MADDAPAEDEAPEIIAKPPSHPITTTLLAIGIVGCVLNISIAWVELFGTYMPAQAEKGMEKHRSVDLAKSKSGPIDHYAIDFPGKDSLWYEVGKELKLNVGQGE